MKSIKSIALAISSLFIFPTVAHAQSLAYQPSQTGLALMRLQTSAFSLPYEQNSGSTIWSRLRGDFRLNEVNPDLVRNHEYKFAANSAYFNRTINRSTPFIYYITQEVQKRNMPAEIVLLPFIESAYVTKARSHVGASGLWQFMPATGRHYGLEQTPLYDGRHDVYAATNAALNYLQYLHGLFDDWSLALAAYNWGEGNLSRAIRRAQEQGLPPTYENLKMPAETRNYVPKLLAVRNLVNNPQAFGLKLPEIRNTPYFKAVEVRDPMDIMAASFLANIPQNEFLSLNPAFKTPVFIPKGKARRMLLPIEAAKTFELNYKEADRKTLLSWDVFTPSSSIDLATLAEQTGNSVSELKSLNGLRSNTVPAGRTILLNKNSLLALNQPISGSLKEFAKLDYDPIPDTFVEQAPVLTEKDITVAIAQSHATQNNTLINNTNNFNTINSIVQSDDALSSSNAVAKETIIAVTPVSATATTMVETPSSKSNTQSVDHKNEFSDIQIVVQNNNQLLEAGSITSNDVTESASEVSKPVQQADDLMTLVQKTQASQAAIDTASKNTAQSSTTAAKTSNATPSKKVDKPKVQSNVAEDKKAKIVAQKESKDKVTQQNKIKAEKASKNKTYEVSAGDTLYSIAKKYNVEVDELIAINGIKGNNIKPGQVLSISSNKRKNNEQTKLDKQSKTAQNSSKEEKNSKNKKSKTPTSHQVKKGDTLESIANRYDLKVNDLKRLNKGSTVLKPGQVLKLRS